MQDKVNSDAAHSEMANEAYLQQLKATFEKLPNDIPLYLFTAKGHEDAFTHANRQVIRAFRELSSKITLREYNLDHELAKQWNVTSSPTLLIAPERYPIRWLGAPMGEEARTFLEILILVGLGQSNLSDQSLKVAKRIDTAGPLQTAKRTAQSHSEKTILGLEPLVAIPGEFDFQVRRITQKVLTNRIHCP